MPDTDRLVCLQNGLVASLEAEQLRLRCEELGITLRDDNGVLDASGPLTPEVCADLKRLKPHILNLLRYTPSDRHIRDDRAPFPDHGPIVVRGTNAR